MNAMMSCLACWMLTAASRISASRILRTSAFGSSSSPSTDGSRFAAGAEALDVIVERGFDVEQRAGDVEQCAFVDRAAVVGHLLDDRALFADDLARHAEAEHAERVADAVEDFGLARQIGRVRVLAAQEDVERFLDAQQVFLDRDRHRVEQVAVVARHRALRVLQLLLRRQQCIEAIRRAHFAGAIGPARSSARRSREDS